MKVIKVRVEEIVKETEKALNLKFAIINSRGGYDWNFWVPKSVVILIQQYDDVLKENQTYALIQPWFFNKIDSEIKNGYIFGVNNNKPIEYVA